MGLVDRHINDFLQEIKRLDPDLRQEINSAQGLFYAQMWLFRNYVNCCIEKAKFEDYEKGMNILARYYPPEIQNDMRFNLFIDAVIITFLDRLLFDNENGPQAWSQTPESIRKAYSGLLEAQAMALQIVQKERSEHLSQKKS